MSKVCMVTGKGPMVGHKVSHSNRKSKKRWLPNLQSKRYWLPSENRFVRLKVSTHGMKIIDKRGIESVVKDLRDRGVLKRD